MPNTIKHISVIGDGGWGTTLAIHLARKKYHVRLWGPFPAYVRHMHKTRLNSKFLPGVRLARNILLTEELDKAINQSDMIVFAVPSKYAAGVLKNIRKTKINLSGKIFVSVTKGIDTGKLLRMSEIILKELGPIPVAVLSGPTIALEVARGIPSTAVVAS